MSLRWIRNVVVDGEKATLEIQLGEKRIGDKSYARVNKEVETWYNAPYFERDKVLEEGKKLLKDRFANRIIKYPDGRDFNWE